MSSTTGASSCLNVLPAGARLAAGAQGQTGIAEYFMVLQSNVWYCRVMYGTAEHCMVLQSNVWYCRVLYGTAG